MILHELAAAWIRANCPKIEVQEDFLRRLDEALQQGVGCSFVIGRQLTRSGWPYLVHCFCGEVFAFQLSPQQAAQLDVKDAMLVAASGRTPHNHEPHPEPPIRLEHVAVDNANALDRSSRIVGTLKYNSDQWWGMPLAIQAACEPAGCASIVLYHHFDGLTRGEDTIRFALPPIGDLRDRMGQPFSGVLPLFFQLCIYGEPENTPPTQHGHCPLPGCESVGTFSGH